MYLRRGLAGPALERVVERARFPITKQPCNLGNGQVLLLQVAFGQIESQIVQHATERDSLGREPPCERSRANAESLRDLRDARLSMRQQRHNSVFGAQSPRPRSCPPAGKRFIAILDQERVEIWIRCYNGQLRSRSRVRNVVDVAAEFDITTKQRFEFD